MFPVNVPSLQSDDETYINTMFHCLAGCQTVIILGYGEVWVQNELSVEVAEGLGNKL